MERHRVWLVHLMMAVLISGSCLAILRFQEYWPFSSYPMYSFTAHQRSLTFGRVFGVTEQVPPREVPLTGYEYLRPFHRTRLISALLQLRRTDREQLGEALGDCLKRYEALRQAGRHSGPPLRSIRLYRCYWKLDSRAQNLDKPDGKALILEVARRSEGA